MTQKLFSELGLSRALQHAIARLGYLQVALSLPEPPLVKAGKPEFLNLCLARNR